MKGLGAGGLKRGLGPGSREGAATANGAHWPLPPPPVALAFHVPAPNAPVTLSAPLTATSSTAAGEAASTGATGAAPGANPGAGQSTFAATAPAANPVFYRTYSRKTVAGRESWHEVAERNLGGLRKLGNLNDDEVALLRRMQEQQMALP